MATPINGNPELKQRVKAAQEYIQMAWKELDKLSYKNVGVEFDRSTAGTLGDVSSQLLRLRSQLAKIQ